MVKEAKTIVFWGTNPVVSNKIAIGVPMHNSYAYYEIMKEKFKKGEMKIYSIDVYRNETAEYFGAHYLAVRPCTDYGDADRALRLSLRKRPLRQGIYKALHGRV